MTTHGEPESQNAGSLPPPVVPPDLYDEQYYRRSCAGSEPWNASEGRTIDPLYPWALHYARLTPGSRVVDVGCGRGELLVAAAKMGASHALGIEYSRAAVDLARHTVEVHALNDSCEVVLADARQLPIEDACADLVTFLDVVEHLSEDELTGALLEARRVLAPGGRVFIHTMPNRYIFSVTYRFLRLSAPWRLAAWPSNPRSEHEKAMHVNEQTLNGLVRALKGAGFSDVRSWRGEWVREDFLPSRKGGRIYRALARRPRTKWLSVADLWADARKASP